MVHPSLDLNGGEEQNDAFGRRDATSHLDEQATRQSELEWETGKAYFGAHGQSGSLEGSHFGGGRREAALVAQACFGMCETQQVRLASTPSFCDGESGRASVRRCRCQADGGAAKAVLSTSNQQPGTSVNGSESAFALAGSMSKGVIAEMRCEYSGARALRSNTVCDLSA